MAIKPIDTLLAIKVLSLVPGLNSNARRAAAALIEHFNRRNACCDPGLERIAGLLDVSERTVMRAIQRLEREKIVRKRRHGGRGHRNSYEPNWSKLAQLEAEWREKFSRKARSAVPQLSPNPRQACHLDGDSAVTQTYRINLPQLTCSKRHSEKQLGTALDSRTSMSSRSATVQSHDVARIAAERRWTDSLNREFGDKPLTYAEIIDAIDEPIRSAATEAELNRGGDGLAYIRSKLKLGTR